MKTLLRLSIAVGALVLAPTMTLSAAQTPEDKGLWIAEEADKRDLGWNDSEVKLNMILRNSHGDSSVRDLRIRSLEVPDRKIGDKSVTIFDKPRDIKGTAFLSHTKIFDPDDQWLYLPALKRVKRISSANKSGPFVGSEFAYEDLVSQEVERYGYKWLRDEACGDLECYVVERTPVYEHSGYTKQIVWMDKTDFQARKLEFYDRKDSLLKTLMLTDYRRYLDTYWRAHTLEMTNHQTGKSTTLTFSDYRFQVGLAEKDFRKNRLKRAK
jgi:outer membrane lipoprotein-sorting protein